MITANKRIAAAMMGREAPGMTADPDDMGYGVDESEEMAALQKAVAGMDETALREAILSAASTDPEVREAIEHACLEGAGGGRGSGMASVSA